MKACYLLLLALLLLPGSMCGAKNVIRHQFIWEQAGAQLMQAHTADEFLQVAHTYNRLVLDGIYNGELFANLGSVLVMGGDGVNAVAALARAERYSGATPETRQGLLAACALQHGKQQEYLPWSRTAFFWHYALACHDRVLAALAGWLLLWLGVLLRLLQRSRRKHRVFSRSFSDACLLSGGVLALLFGASVFLTLLHEQHDIATWPERVFGSPLNFEGEEQT